MDSVVLGSSGVRASALAFGTDLVGSKIDAATSFRLLDHFAEHGGTLIDTANFYASWIPGCEGGESEAVIGRWMKERQNRPRVAISTKLGFDYPGSPGGLTKTEIERECERSLRRLGTDFIDVYYAHRDDRDTPLEETMEAFHRLIAAGKVRAAGASNLMAWRVAQSNVVARAQGWPGYSVVEQRYTYLRPRHGADFGPQIFISPEMKDFAEANGVALIGYSVLLRGAYTRADRQLPAQFAGPDSEERLRVLHAIAKETGCSSNQVVIAWMRQSDPPILPIVAASRVEHLIENIEALKLELSPDQMRRLDAAGNAEIKQAWLQPA